MAAPRLLVANAIYHIINSLHPEMKISFTQCVHKRRFHSLSVSKSNKLKFLPAEQEFLKPIPLHSSKGFFNV